MAKGVSGRRNNMYKCPVARGSMENKEAKKRSVWLRGREQWGAIEEFKAEEGIN